MAKYTDKELKDIKNEIKDIRSTMNISGSAFRLVYSADNFRKFFLLSGIFSLIFPLFYQILLWVCKSQIPKPMMILFYVCIFVCWCVLIAVRTRVSIKIAKELNIKSSFWHVAKQILSTKMWLAIVPIILVFIAVPIKYSAFATPDYVPYFGIVLGLILNMIGVMIHEREYSVCGIWMIISGAGGLSIFAFPVHIAFAVILAPACFLFVIANSMKNKGRNDEVL